MKLVHRVAALAALAVVQSFATSISQAAFIDGAVSGPGGFGSSGVFVGSGSSLAEPSLTYTSINYLDVSLQVDAAGTYQVSETPAFGSAHNTTGQAWSGFTWQVISGPASLVYDYSGPAFSGIEFTSTFGNATGSSTFATFAGGTAADGAFIEPNFNLVVSAPGTFVLRETPIAVPEPGSLALLSIGAAILGYCLRVRKQSAAALERIAGQLRRSTFSKYNDGLPFN